MAKFHQTLCEVCGEPVNPLEDYRDWFSDKTYSPREYVEHQLQMSEDEKQRREEFAVAMFREYEEKKLAGSAA